jgi:predicted site-specific integrase-resolvase
MRPNRVDFRANGTYRPDYILIGHFSSVWDMRVKAKATTTLSVSTAEGGKLIGYARVSTTDQDLAVQRQALGDAGVDVIFEEKASGTKRDGRTELQKVLSVLGNGDALVVTRLDRLGRSLRDLANIAHEIEQVGAHLKVIEQDVDTSTAAAHDSSRITRDLRGPLDLASLGDSW